MSAPDSRPAAPVLELRDVHVRHRVHGDRLFVKETVYALTDANVIVDAGQTLGIVGESGCGKSTLAQAVVGLRRPDEGDVVFHGRSLWTMTPKERRSEFGRDVGMIFQDPSTALNRRLPVRRILQDPLDVHRIGTTAARRARVREVMDLVGLPASAAEVLPAQLSGGQRQRVAIGRALALGPSLLVADEPTSALDVSVRAQILNLLLQLKADLNLAMIFISHDIQTVKRMSDRIATMYLGRIVEEAPASAVPGGVRHPYTAALLSATPSILHETTPIGMPGPVPSAINPPLGCPFHPRCFRAQPDCARTLPALVVHSEVPLHAYRCFHPVEPGLSYATPPAEAVPEEPAESDPAMGDLTVPDHPGDLIDRPAL